LMMMGKQLFGVKEEGLTFSLQPILPSWLFDSEGKVHFTLLGRTEVTYHNPSKRNTFGANGAKTMKYVLHLNGEKIEVNTSQLQESYAKSVRDGKVERMDVYLD
jgi:hypothetical protein